MRPTTACHSSHERADIFCMQPARRPLDAGFRSYCCDVGSFCLRMLSMDIDIGSSNRMALLPISSRPMPWNPFSSTTSISLSYRQDAVSEHRNRSVVGKLGVTGSGDWRRSDRPRPLPVYPTNGHRQTGPAGPVRAAGDAFDWRSPCAFQDKQMEQVASLSATIETHESVEPRRYLEPPPSHGSRAWMNCQHRFLPQQEKERHEGKCIAGLKEEGKCIAGLKEEGEMHSRSQEIGSKLRSGGNSIQTWTRAL